MLPSKADSGGIYVPAGEPSGEKLVFSDPSGLYSATTIPLSSESPDSRPEPTMTRSPLDSTVI